MDWTKLMEINAKIMVATLIIALGAYFILSHAENIDNMESMVIVTKSCFTPMVQHE